MSKFTYFGLFLLSFCALLSTGKCWTFSLPHHRLFGQHHNDMKNPGDGKLQFYWRICTKLAVNAGNMWLDKSADEILWPVDKVIMDEADDQQKDDKANPESSVPFLRISGSPWQRFKLGNRKWMQLKIDVKKVLSENLLILLAAFAPEINLFALFSVETRTRDVFCWEILYFEFWLKWIEWKLNWAQSTSAMLPLAGVMAKSSLLLSHF